MLAKKLNYIVIALIACIMKGSPFIKTFAINLNRVTIFSTLNNRFDLVIKAIFTILSKKLVIFIYVSPELFPNNLDRCI